MRELRHSTLCNPNTRRHTGVARRRELCLVHSLLLQRNRGERWSERRTAEESTEMLHLCYKTGFTSFSCNPTRVKGISASLLGAWLTDWTRRVGTNERIRVMSQAKLSFERAAVPDCQLFQLGHERKPEAQPLPSGVCSDEMGVPLESTITSHAWGHLGG